MIKNVAKYAGAKLARTLLNRGCLGLDGLADITTDGGDSTTGGLDSTVDW